jgi:DNA-directed RNA polymerase subunit RPC12/RpoP
MIYPSNTNLRHGWIQVDADLASSPLVQPDRGKRAPFCMSVFCNKGRVDYGERKIMEKLREGWLCPYCGHAVVWKPEQQ